MIINKRMVKLFKKLKNKKYRDAFVVESINVGVPFQIKALRDQRGLTQKDFEKISGIKQTLISRLENPSYSSFTLSTLKKIASTYDVGLIVRFVPISDLVKWKLSLNSESLKALSYEDDPYFDTVERRERLATSDEQNITISLPETSGKVIELENYTTKKNAPFVSSEANVFIRRTSCG